MKKCMSCGYTTNNDSERFCTKCGMQLQTVTMAAPNANMQGQPQMTPNMNMQGQPQMTPNANMQGQNQPAPNPNGQIINRENLNAAVDAKLNAVKKGVSKAAKKAGVSAEGAKAKAEEVSKKLPFEINKKRILIAAASVFVIFIIAFALTANRRSCKKAVNNMFDQMDTYMVSQLNSTFADSLNISQETVADLGLDKFMDAYNAPFSYKIKSLKIDGKEAKAELKIKNKVMKDMDVSDVLEEAFSGDSVSSVVTQMLTGGSKSIMKTIIKKVEKVRESGTTTEYDGVVRLEKKYGDWVIKSVTPDVIRGYLGEESDVEITDSDAEELQGIVGGITAD